MTARAKAGAARAATITIVAGVCRVCGCTDDDCSGCVERTGEPCFWVQADLCSACVLPAPRRQARQPRAAQHRHRRGAH